MKTTAHALRAIDINSLILRRLDEGRRLFDQQRFFEAENNYLEALYLIKIVKDYIDSRMTQMHLLNVDQHSDMRKEQSSIAVAYGLCLEDLGIVHIAAGKRNQAAFVLAQALSELDLIFRPDHEHVKRVLCRLHALCHA